MRTLSKMSSAAVLCATIAASIAPTSSFAGVMSITDKASVSLSSPTDQVDWRAYPHRHHRWHMGWYYGRAPRYSYGMYAPGVYGSAAPYCNYGYGTYGAAYPGYYGWGGSGLFGLGTGIF